MAEEAVRDTPPSRALSSRLVGHLRLTFTSPCFLCRLTDGGQGGCELLSTPARRVSPVEDVGADPLAPRRRRRTGLRLRRPAGWPGWLCVLPYPTHCCSVLTPASRSPDGGQQQQSYGSGAPYGGQQQGGQGYVRLARWCNPRTFAYRSISPGWTAAGRPRRIRWTAGRLLRAQHL